MFGLGMPEVLVIGIVALLLFGQRLPEVARTLGKKYAEFRKGLTDIQSQMNLTELYSPSSTSSYPSSSPSYSSSRDDGDDYEEATAPRFQPPPSEPQPPPTAISPPPAAAASIAGPPAPAAAPQAGNAGSSQPA
jgi:sec-independent protein translocase protein TatA